MGRPRYVFPRDDCALLPVPNTTVEMLAQYLAGRVRKELAASDGVDVTAVEGEVEETIGQAATYPEALGGARPAASMSARPRRPSCRARAASTPSTPRAPSRANSRA